MQKITNIILYSVILTTAVLFLGGMARWCGKCSVEREDLLHQNTALLHERSVLIQDNERLFREQAIMENELDGLIFGDFEQDSILTQLYKIRHER
jgi:hypothetical protein